MFKNNPEVKLPVAILNKQVDIQANNKNKNSLFSTSTYKDLPDLHAHMVCLGHLFFSIIIYNIITLKY